MMNLTRENLYKEAGIFIAACYKELGKPAAEVEERMRAIERSIQEKGCYDHTFEELEHGARMAWRHSNRCIGRLFWQRLKVIDARSAHCADDVFDFLFDHLKLATNGGKIRPVITIFAPDTDEGDTVRIWNHQLIRYAGYETEDGIIGDPHSVAFTKQCLALGWKGAGGYFDILPLVVQIGKQKPEWRTIPESLVLEVPIEHPRYPIFGDFHVKWYGVPVISDMRLEIGGINYKAAPFNGWYMGTEIGARDLADKQRYNLLPLVAENLHLDTASNRSLWQDRALVELNLAVLDSYQKHGVTIIDHHTAAEQFKVFEQKESAAGRQVTGRWSWLIPPVSPATTHMFHHRYEDVIRKPAYFRQTPPY